jgi:hypothetical protein
LPAAPHTSTSSAPNVSTAFVMAASMAAESRTSAENPCAVVPWPLSSTSAASSFSCLRARMLTFAPACPKASARRRLMPLEPPVMKTWRFR